MFRSRAAGDGESFGQSRQNQEYSKNYSGTVCDIRVHDNQLEQVDTVRIYTHLLPKTLNVVEIFGRYLVKIRKGTVYYWAALK